MNHNIMLKRVKLRYFYQKKLIRGQKYFNVLTLFAALTILCLHPAHAQSRKTIEIPVSEGITIPLSQPAQTIFIADPNVADIQAPSNTTIFMFGKRPGKTTLFALDENGNKILSQQILVYQPLDEVRKLLAQEIGKDIITLRPTPGGVIMSGTVASPEIAETAKTLLVQSLGSGTALVNRVKIAGKLQVSLHVRVIEVARSINKELNLNWSSLGDMGQVALIGAPPPGAPPITANGSQCCIGKTVLQRIDELAAGGLISVLAEPNLTAVSGESASFLAGGEFPIPVTQGQNGAVTIQYQSYGVGLDFVPTVLSDDLISIKVKPEVSEMSSQSVSSGNLTVPYMTTRRAQTTVELGSGQSFAIGGLIRKTSTKSLAPESRWDRIPFLGGLIQATSHQGTLQRNDSELVIIVTPYIVRPAPTPKALQAPYVIEKTSATIGLPPQLPPPLPASDAPRSLLPLPQKRFIASKVKHKPVLTAKPFIKDSSCMAKHKAVFQLRDGPALASTMPFGPHCGAPAKIIALNPKTAKTPEAPVEPQAPVEKGNE